MRSLAFLICSGCIFITAADRESRAVLLANDTAGDDDDVLGDDDNGEVAGTWTDVSVGSFLSCAIDDRFDLTCWGDEEVNTWFPSVPDGLDVIGVSVGTHFGCAWDSTGDTRCFGPAEGTDQNPERSILEQPSGSYTKVACGNRECCGLSQSEGLECWDTTMLSTGDLLGFEPASTYTDVALWGGACAIIDGGDIDCWTSVTTGGADPASWPPNNEAVFASPEGHICAQQEGQIGCWNVGTGSGAVSLLDISPSNANNLTEIVGASNGSQIAGICGLLGGAVTCFAPEGQSPKVPSAPEGSWTQLSINDHSGCVIDTAGNMSCWGGGDHVPN